MVESGINLHFYLIESILEKKQLRDNRYFDDIFRREPIKHQKRYEDHHSDDNQIKVGEFYRNDLILLIIGLSLSIVIGILEILYFHKTSYHTHVFRASTMGRARLSTWHLFYKYE